MHYSVVCSEDEPLFAASNIDRRRHWQTYQGADSSDAFQEVCKLWPKGPVDSDLHSPLHSDVPTLLLSGEADPVTPPEDAERAGPQGLTYITETWCWAARDTVSSRPAVCRS